MKEIIEETVKYLKAGKIILYPTDTVWGLGCDATNAKAVEKIYKIKQRVTNKSMIVLIDSADKLKDYMKEVPVVTYDLIAGINTPLTIIYPQAKNLAKNVIANDKSIAIRVVKDEFCKKLIEKFGKPIVSTSANLSSERTPIIFSKISEQIIKNVDYIVKLFQNSINKVKPSTIVKLSIDGKIEILRQ